MLNSCTECWCALFLSLASKLTSKQPAAMPKLKWSKATKIHKKLSMGSFPHFRGVTQQNPSAALLLSLPLKRVMFCRQNKQDSMNTNAPLKHHSSYISLLVLLQCVLKMTFVAGKALRAIASLSLEQRRETGLQSSVENSQISTYD